MMDTKKYVLEIAKRARDASYQLAVLSTEVKNKALREMAGAIESSKARIMEANAEDIEAAKKKGLSPAFIDRLTLNASRFQAMVDRLKVVEGEDDPIGSSTQIRRPNGLEISRVTVPLGVIGIIYESRPDVTSDASALCIKAGNCVILRGGSDSIKSNMAIISCLQDGAGRASIPEGAVQLIEETSYGVVTELLGLNEYIDIIIPRGGEKLIEAVTRDSKIPVIKHFKGVCHTYIDEGADIRMAEKIALNAKVQRPGVCNAMETLLVNEKIARDFLPSFADKLTKAGVEIRGCPETQKILSGISRASEEDWGTEYLDLILSIKVVPCLEDAIGHINRYGTRHSDAIVTDNYKNARIFTQQIDSACVYVNASTRFTDGYEFGMGSEIGISTDKFHARGPMGLTQLTSYKYVVHGSGQVRT